VNGRNSFDNVGYITNTQTDRQTDRRVQRRYLLVAK